MANNADWLNSLNYIDFLRDVGRHFSVKPHAELRLGEDAARPPAGAVVPRIQLHDPASLRFRRAQQAHRLRAADGGSDQWGNIVNGIDLGRRMSNVQLFALTSPLITTKLRRKMGKTAAARCGSNADLVSPYELLAIWRNTEDGDGQPLSSCSRCCRSTRSAGLRRCKARRSTRAKKVLATKRPRWCMAVRRPTPQPTPRAAPSKKARMLKTAGRLKSRRRTWPTSACSRRSSAPASSLERRGARQIKGGGLKVNDMTVTDERWF